MLLFFSFYSIFSRQRGNEPREIDATDFYGAVENGEVLDLHVKGTTVFLHLKGGNVSELPGHAEFLASGRSAWSVSGGGPWSASPGRSG